MQIQYRKIKYRTNTAVNTATVVFISAGLRAASLQRTCAMKPAAIPVVTEYPKVMPAIVMNAGMELSIELKSTLRISRKIISPTTIRTGAVDAALTTLVSGAKKIARVKHAAVVRAVSPVFPPAAIPAADSAYEVTVEEPKNDPKVVARASAIMMRCIPL